MSVSKHILKDVVDKKRDRNGFTIEETLECGHVLGGQALKTLKPGKQSRMCMQCKKANEQEPSKP